MQENDSWTASRSSGDPSRASIHILSPGCEVGDRYEIHNVLGVGGYGVVYAAFDKHLRRRVALKVLRNDRLSDVALVRFRREVAVAHDVESPHLVRVFDIAQSGDSTYLTMELVDGESLAEVIGRGRMPIEDVIAVARQILLALEPLHRVGIVHRDVKPSNVMITREQHVKLTDFGLARRMDSARPSRRRSRRPRPLHPRRRPLRPHRPPGRQERRSRGCGKGRARVPGAVSFNLPRGQIQSTATSEPRHTLFHR